MLTRERPLAPAGTLPPPAPLPSLPTAFSRRTAIFGAVAATGALAGTAARALAPEGAVMGNPIADAPDAELHALLGRYPVALAAMKAASDRAEALWKVFAAREPERPEALRVRFGDDFSVSQGQYRTPDGRWSWFYEVAAADELREQALPTRSEWEGEPAPRASQEQVGRWVPVPDERAIARRVEIMAAHDRWWAECDAIKAQIGIPAADEAEERATLALRALEASILATEPATFAGLAAKARWAAACPHGAVIAADWRKRVTEDVVAFAEHQRMWA